MTSGMTKPIRAQEKEIYDARMDIAAVVLYENDLLELERTLREDAAQLGVSFRLVYDGYTLSDDSMSKLIEEARRKMGDKMPKELEISLFELDGEERHVLVMLRPGVSHGLNRVVLRGQSEVWVLGNFKKLERFFSKRVPFYAWVPKVVPWLFYLAAAVFPPIFINAAINGNRWIAFLSLGAWLLFFVLGVLNLSNRLIRRVRIYLSPPTDTRLYREWISLIFTVVGALAGVAAFLLILADWLRGP